jgi:hypothetical protein
MKIKITENIPVGKQCKPKLGEVYEVIEKHPKRQLYYILVNGNKVGVFALECKVIED